MAGEEDAEFHRRHEPFVRIHNDRVRMLHAVPNESKFGADRRRACIGGVDVEPASLAPGDLADGGNGIDGDGRRRAGGGDDGAGNRAGGAVAADGLVQGVGAHAHDLVRRDLDDVVLSDAQGHSPFFNRRMRLLRAINLQWRQAAPRPVVPFVRISKPRRSRAAARTRKTFNDAVSLTVAKSPSGSPNASRSHCRTTISTSVSDGDVRHSMPLALTAAHKSSAKTPAWELVLGK